MAEFTALPTKLSSTGPFSFVDGPNYMPFPPAVGGTTTVIVQGASGTTFLFRGFFPVTSQFEYWSGPSVNTAPPSGQALVDITIIGQHVS